MRIRAGFRLFLSDAVPIGTSVANWSRMLTETTVSCTRFHSVASVSDVPATRALSIDYKVLAEFLAMQRWGPATGRLGPFPTRCMRAKLYLDVMIRPCEPSR